MKLKLKYLLYAAVMVAAASNAYAATGMPGFWGDTHEPWTAKYFYAPLDSTTPAEDWYTMEFDDSSWEMTDGAINKDGTAPTTWPKENSAYWLRCHFDLDATDNIDGATLKVHHNYACQVWLNGENVYEGKDYNSSPKELYIDSSLFRKGGNVLAVYVGSYWSSEGYIDFGLQPDWNEVYWNENVIDANVTVPGTLGDIILGKVDNFTDVVSVRISGKLNSEDMETLGKRMTNVEFLDMSKADLKEIGNSAFKSRTKLKKVIFPENLEKIGNYAFSGCSALKDVVFQASLRNIGSSAFSTTALTSVSLPEGLVSVESGAFYNCKQLESVSLPSTLKEIKGETFQDNTSLSEIKFSEGLETIGSHAFYENSISELNLPSSLRTIGTYAFMYSRQLREIKFNEGLFRIGDGAFFYCDSIREVTLPSTLVRAEGTPFYSCDNLRKVTCLSVEPPYLPNEIIGGSMEERELYVPAISLNVYKQTKGWDKFPSIKPIDYLPEDIRVARVMRLTLLENLPAGYKPDMSLLYDKTSNPDTYGRLELNGDVNVSLGRLSMVMDPNGSESWHPYTALINNANMQADSVQATVYLPSRRWTFISFPFDVRVNEILPCEEGTTSYVIRRYSGANRAAGESGSTWQDLKDDDIMKAGEGYIIQAVRYIGNSSKSSVGLLFTAMDNENLNNVFISSDATAVLSEYPAELEHNRGWNLVGNPYPCYYDSRFMSLEAPVTVWDKNYSTYKVYSPLDDSYVFTPGEAFFVQCPKGNPEFVFDVEGRQKTREVRELSEPARIAALGKSRKVFDLRLTGPAGEDATRVVFNDEAAVSYESNRDAAKFFSPEESVGQIYTIVSDVEYSINERPAADGMVALGVRIGESGTHMISLTREAQGYQVWLDDAETGDSVRLDGSEGYSFTADPGQAVGRFTLRFVGADINSVEGIGSEAADGHRSGMYTIDGRHVAQPESGTIHVKDGKKVIIK